MYSIQRKMRRKGVPLEEIYDARALRVVIDDEDGRQQARFALSNHTATHWCETCAHASEQIMKCSAGDPARAVFRLTY